MFQTASAPMGEPTRIEEQGPKTEEQPVHRAQVRGSLARAPENKQLLFQKHAFGDDGSRASGPQEHGQSGEQV